ncbi:unnamed protein product [Adineta steineri]|uniref:Uncharacterized protein n=1 Tax=Adineta steineri TaxID=433720 RepID=A0A813R6C6_9BILA|nr:unnamed protein product [Adineta steineri]CAF0779288.1 unnamed protein product [Adineta steineri]CAF0795471.1 unnamed protein product [Adineta steineri]CAF3719239.1 unnamed protein product [Adineta steineri]CAF3896014.1 unnamed protein product [Adineta steineri]
MEWYAVVGILLIIILAVILGIILACMLSGQRCTVSIQQRQPNHELTQIQQEQERKRQKKFSTRLKRTLSPSTRRERPLEPVEDVKTVEFTLKLGDTQKPSQEAVLNNESAQVLLPPIARVTQAELDQRQKKRDEIRKKYNL